MPDQKCTACRGQGGYHDGARIIPCRYCQPSPQEQELKPCQFCEELPEFIRCVDDRYQYTHYCSTGKRSVTISTMRVSTEKEATVTIEFWETNTIDHYLSERSVDKKDHEITLLKLKPKTLYHYEFIIEDRDNLTRSDENTFKTDSLPDILPTYSRKGKRV